jgi:hypothetical protein
MNDTDTFSQSLSSSAEYNNAAYTKDDDNVDIYSKTNHGDGARSCYIQDDVPDKHIEDEGDDLLCDEAMEILTSNEETAGSSLSHKIGPSSDPMISDINNEGTSSTTSTKHNSNCNTYSSTAIATAKYHKSEERQNDEWFCNERIEKSTPFNEKFSNGALKEMYILASQDAALLFELASLVRERALYLACMRHSYEDSM